MDVMMIKPDADLAPLSQNRNAPLPEPMQQEPADENSKPPTEDIPATMETDEEEPLPTGWAHVMDNVTGRLFYIHDDGRKQLDHPSTEIPKLWYARKDHKSGLTYYQHILTGASHWAVPVIPGPPGSETLPITSKEPHRTVGVTAIPPPPPPPPPPAQPKDDEPAPVPMPVPTGDAGVAAALLHANVYLKNEAAGRYLQLKTSTGVLLSTKGPAKCVCVPGPLATPCHPLSPRPPAPQA